MTKATPPRPIGNPRGQCKILPHIARLFVAFLVFHSPLVMNFCTGQARTDNRRIFYTGSHGAVWDNATASWMTSGSFLAYAYTGTGNAGVVWHTTIPGTGEPVVAQPEAAFLSGDVVVFDSLSDVPPVMDPDTGQFIPGDPTFTRTINIAPEGVKVSDLVVAGAGSFVFTGGAITADAFSMAPNSIQLTGTGVGAAANATRPTGSLIKVGGGAVILSNTAPNHFPGGIHLLEGKLSITDNRALGDNVIITNYMTPSGGAQGTYGYDYFLGEDLLDIVQRPSGTTTAFAISHDDNNTTLNGFIITPAVVTNAAGEVLHSGGAVSPIIHVAPEAAGLDITGDIYVSNRVVVFDIEGDTTISGRIVGGANAYGSNAGTIVKNGPGTLTITGTRNWFYGASKYYNQINEGRLVITSPRALGMGATMVTAGAVLECRGVVGTMRQAFVGGGDLEITEGSDLTFNWRNGTLDDFDGMSGNGSWHPAMNELGRVTVSGQSRFSAIASGTYSTVLGGAMVFVTVTEGSTLVLGREGLSARGSGATEIPMHYPIYANRLDMTGGSSLVLMPNAYLSTGAFLFSENSTIIFPVSGVSRIWYGDGTTPDRFHLPGAECDLSHGHQGGPIGTEEFHYIVPVGMELTINEIPAASGYYREYVVVNQGANPLKDIAMTLSSLDAVHDTLSSRLADELVDPVTNHVPSEGRNWVNEAWVRYIHSEIEYDAGGITTPGMTGRISNVIAGIDALLPGRVVFGLHIGMGDNSLETTNDTNLSSKQKFFGIHAAQRFGRVHIAAAAATGKGSTDTFRYEGGNSIRGKWDTSYYSASIEAGATFNPWRKLILRPYVGLRYSNLKVGGYYERGLSPLVVDDFSDTSAQAIFGLAAGYKFTVFKRDAALNLSLARKNAIKTPRSTLDTHYFDAPATPLTLQRGDYYSGITTAGLSARVALSAHTIVGLAADYETASTYNRLTGTVLVGYTW